VGYRRHPVTILQGGWAIDLPGSFSDERFPDRWSGSDAGRTVTLAAGPTAIDGRPMSAQAFLAEYAADLGKDALEHLAGPVRGRARITSDASTGIEIGRLEGYSGAPGSGAVLRIEFENPSDWKWALDTWRGVRPL
jgi:hypothetical protein